MIKRFIYFLVIFFSTAPLNAKVKEDTLLVFAPASLIDVLPKLAVEWTLRSKVQVEFQFAATSQLARQVREGAVADVLIVAQENWAKELLKEGHILPPTLRKIISNQLVLVQSFGSSQLPVAPGDIAGLRAILQSASKIGLAGEEVPAGVYATEALRHEKLWELVENKVVRGDHVRTVTRWLKTGVVPYGIVYYTDAAAMELSPLYTFPAHAHGEISYVGAVVKKGGHPKYGAAFLDFLTSGPARKVFESQGFKAPEAHFSRKSAR